LVAAHPWPADTGPAAGYDTLTNVSWGAAPAQTRRPPPLTRLPGTGRATPAPRRRIRPAGADFVL